MQGREIQIDGVTGNPLGGGAYQVGNAFSTANDALYNAAYSSGSAANGAVSGAYGGAYGSNVYQSGTQYQTGGSQYQTGGALYQTGGQYQTGGAQRGVTTGYTTTSTYQQPAQTTTYYQQQVSQPVTTTTQYISQPVQSTYVNQQVTSTGYANQAPQVVNTVVNTGKEVIKGESRIEYVPFEKKIVEYK